MKKRIYSKNKIELILIVVFFAFLLWLSITLVVSEVKKDMMKELKTMQQSIIDQWNVSYMSMTNYTQIEKRSAKIGAYYLKHTADPYSPETLTKLKNIMEMSAVYIIDHNGTVISKSADTKDLSLYPEDLKELCGVTAENPFSESVREKPSDTEQDQTESPEEKNEEVNDSEDDDAFGTIDEAQQVVEGNDALLDVENSQNSHLVETDEEDKEELLPEEIYEANLTLCSYYLDPEHILVVSSGYLNDYVLHTMRKTSFDVVEASRYGNNGFYLEVFDEGNIVLGPKRITGNLDITIPENVLKDGYGGLVDIKGEKYYCTVLEEKEIKSINYLLCAIPVKELRFSVIFISLTTLAVVLVSLILLRSYAQILVVEASDERNKTVSKNSYRYRLSALVFICICATLATSIFSHILFLYSFTTSSSVTTATDIQDTLETLNTLEEDGSGSYKKVIRIFCRTAESLISENPEFENHKKLKELTDILGVDHILVYNESGVVTVSDMNYDGLALSSNPDDLSHEFFWVIRGQDFLLQNEADSEYLKDPYIFAGVPLQDKKGDYRGLVQLAINPDFKSALVYTTSLETILATICESNDTTALAIDTETKIVISPDIAFNNLKLEELGVSEDVIIDEYIGFVTVQNENMMGCCKAVSKYWMLVVSSIYKIPLNGAKSGAMSALPGIVSELLYFLVLMFDINRYRTQLGEVKLEESEEEAPLSLKAEEHILTQLGLMAIIFSGIITFIFLAGGSLFKKNSNGYFIFVYHWPKGFNVFTVTRCLAYICVAAFVMFVLNNILSLLASLLASKQETVIRLILSFLKYFGWIVVICFCLNTLGLPTTSLLASAGALTVIFSIGAQSIVADILAGLFIIFEGSFKVGDMITVEDWHGQVMEIGIRNTTIKDLINSDVKIMNNSTIKKVINFSRYPSFCKIIIGTEYSADIRELEAIIQKERKTIKENIPEIIGEFRYLGVEEFGDSAIFLKFEGACRNQDFDTVRRKINRELKLMFDRNGINVPFTQVVIHQEK